MVSVKYKCAFLIEKLLNEDSRALNQAWSFFENRNLCDGTGHTQQESGPVVTLYPVSNIISDKEALNKYLFNIINKLLGVEIK